jgi:ribosomal protein S12 methylthiotransferase accessory factor
MEVVERDAFMLAWYRRHVAARIDTQTVKDETSQLLIRRFETLGYGVSIFDIGTEFDICAVWVLLIRRDGGTPYSFSIAAAGTIPEKVVQKALRELTPIMQAHIGMSKAGSLAEQRARRLAERPEEVVEMSDHALRYFVPETADAFGFALDADRTVRMASLTERSAYLVSDDLCEDLCRVVDVFERRGHEVIVVDQTSYEQKALGLCTTKVLVPGMLTLHFGEARRRFRGMPRMVATRHVPGTLNADPHPFP